MILSETRAFQIAKEITDIRPDLAVFTCRLARPGAGWEIVAGLAEVLEKIKEDQDAEV